ncbi:LLM class flavin-dependent oxidoreductase [Halarchaeum acidiphilum]|uniref:LLM class flavin-dependent oxidoreductase n=1 Tax=Halarchaeum acidiphilum TaxID=489138 RepID=UPI0009DBDCB7|nr:LLM class flavin-dependent oxidoreductase [Halarchaeum acidiphilum]
MDLSIVDLSPVPEDGTAADAYANTVETARQAERLGYERVWTAEHHGMADRLAGTTPEVLLGRLAGATDEIRLGTGAMLLNHYSPLKAAETFGALDALAPGRIDAGLGRASNSPAVDRALGTERRVPNPDEDHREKIEPSSATFTTPIPRATRTRTSRSRAPTRPRPSRGCSAPTRRAPPSRANSACATVSRRSSAPSARRRPSRPTASTSIPEPSPADPTTPREWSP